MKSLYLDSGAVVKLYVVEPGSQRIAQAVQSAQVLPLNHLQETEVQNALHAVGGRRDLAPAACRQALDHFSEDWASEVFLRMAPDWTRIWHRAQTLARDHTPFMLCRTLDILHVVLAQSAKADAVMSGDKGQITLSKAIGLKLIQVPTRD